MKSVPCALLVNDIHVNKDALSEFVKNWDEALEICRDNKIEYIIVGGDLWLSRSSQTLATLMVVRTALIKATNEYGLYVILANGNHDKNDLEGVEGYNHLFSGYESVEVVGDHTEVDLTDDLSLWVISYFPESGSFTERLERLKQECSPDKINILYAHEGIRGGLTEPHNDELPTQLFDGFAATLCGHYHDRRKINGTSIEYIGSSRQHNFGEDEEKGYTILYTNGTTKFIKNQVNTRYACINAEYKDVNEKLYERIAKIKENPLYRLRLRITCTNSQATLIDKQKLAELGVDKLELVSEEEMQSVGGSESISKKFDKEGIKKEYEAFCAEKSVNNQLGLKYLENLK